MGSSQVLQHYVFDPLTLVSHPFCCSYLFLDKITWLIRNRGSFLPSETVPVFLSVLFPLLTPLCTFKPYIPADAMHTAIQKSRLRRALELPNLVLCIICALIDGADDYIISRPVVNGHIHSITHLVAQNRFPKRRLCADLSIQRISSD